MGSAPEEAWRDEDEKGHEVRLAHRFFLGAHPVTRGQFASFVRATRYATEAEGGGLPRGPSAEWKLDRGCKWKHPGFAQDDDHPAACVSWNDAQKFCDGTGFAGCQRTPNGNVRAGPGPRRLTGAATSSLRLRRSTAMRSWAVRRLPVIGRRPSGPSRQIRGVCTTCTAIYGSGASTATDPIGKQELRTRKGRLPDNAANSAAAPGGVGKASCARRRAISWNRPAATKTPDSGFVYSFYTMLFPAGRGFPNACKVNPIADEVPA